MDSSLDTAASSDGPLVEVTLQSLCGLSCQSPGTQIPTITAAVGFAGSASDMQVSSSFLSSSGNVVVESSPAILPREVENQSSCPLLVEWRESERSLNQSFSSTASSQAPQQPHLTIRLPERDAKLPSVPLSKMNRDCNIVEDPQPPSLDESDTSSQTAQQQLELEAHKSDIRGASVVWSASGAAMPDIIELHVSLIMDKDRKDNDDYKQTTYPVGIAYLVFFGSDTGTTVLDLPIKQQSAAKTFADVSLDDDAFLRVRVNVMSSGAEKSPSPNRQESFFTDMQKLEPILQELHMAHEAEQQGGIDEQPAPEVRQGSRFLCNADVGFINILKSLSGVVKQCDGGEGALQRTDSMGSTIVTSASLGI
jgi:hypothetical protein